ASRQAARERACLPNGFRHEMLSVQMAETSAGSFALPKSEDLRSLALYLVGTHHGYARPFAPLVEDDAPPGVSLTVDGESITVTEIMRIEHPPHALSSGFVERFWEINRRYGWWGTAFLEAVLRIADQQASANPSKSP